MHIFGKDNPNIGVSMHHDQGTLMKEGQPQNSVKSMYYNLASQIFSIDGNLKRLGIWKLDFKDELRSGWGMFTKSKLVNRENGESGEAQLLVTFTPESGKSPMKLVGGEMIIAFMCLQGLKLRASNPMDTSLFELLEDNMDKQIMVSVGLLFKKGASTTINVTTYVNMMYLHQVDAVAEAAKATMLNMSFEDKGEVEHPPVVVKKPFRTRLKEWWDRNRVYPF